MLALTLTMAMLGQAPTTVIEIDGTCQSFYLSWGLDGNLWLELYDPATVMVNGAKPAAAMPVAIAAINLSLSPAEQARNPYRCTVGSVVLGYQYTSIAYTTESSLIGFTFGGAINSAITGTYSLLAFNYGAYFELSLYPAAGGGEAIAEVVGDKTKSSGVGGTATWSLVLAANNRLLNPTPWQPKFLPGVPY